MKYDITIRSDELLVTLTESLALPEGRLPHLGSFSVQRRLELLRQIQSLTRELLNGFVDEPGGLQQASPALGCRGLQ
jgi:hypothetical protein